MLLTKFQIPAWALKTSDMYPCTCSLPSSPSISKFISDHPPLSLLEKQCTNMRDLRQLHTQIIKTGLAKDTIATSRLLAFCATSPSGDLHYAELLFSRTHKPNAFMWNTLIRGLSQSSTPYKAIHFFHDMLHSPIEPQRLTFPSLFVAYAHLGLPHDGNHLHGMVIKLGLASDPYVHNSIISMYVACGRMAAASQLFSECLGFDIVSWNCMVLGFARIGLIDESKRLFDQMPEKNEITWSSMISGYVRNGKNKKALDLFHQMQEIGLKPSAWTLVSLLGACACLGALEQGEWIHTYIKNNKVELNSIVSTAIINMYCKCGSISKAIQVFEDIPTKGLSSWNSVISGLALHGRGKEAIECFSRLESSGLPADHVTFVGILTACSHSGMVNEAQHYFSLMTDVYGIEPRIEHYGCMVDLLGRAGLVKESEELIHSMPMKPDSVIWGSLLAACRIHGCNEIGKRAAAKIIELDPGDSGGYVLLSNTCASVGDFGDATNTRVMMRHEEVWKEPGCSMIEVNGVVYEIVAGGVLFPGAREAYEVLDNLAMKLDESCHVELSFVEYMQDYYWL